MISVVSLEMQKGMESKEIQKFAFTKKDQILSHKTQLNKFKILEIIQCIL